MSDNNIYDTPQSRLVNQVATNDAPLASRWARLGASILDSIVMMVVLSPVAYLTGGFENIMNGVKPDIMYTLGMGVLGFATFLAINYRFLVEDGQTIGKTVLKIKIVDMDGNIPAFKSQLLVRYAAYLLTGNIPVVGQYLNIINILFIFGKEKRCVHDMIAKTKVVKC